LGCRLQTVPTKGIWFAWGHLSIDHLEKMIHCLRKKVKKMTKMKNKIFNIFKLNEITIVKVGSNMIHYLLTLILTACGLKDPFYFE
jgi:hypothetical protein